MSERLRVLFVCTGNICRSAAAERLLRAALPPDAHVVTASAGTHTSSQLRCRRRLTAR